MGKVRDGHSARAEEQWTPVIFLLKSRNDRNDKDDVGVNDLAFIEMRDPCDAGMI
jgi:hypothetical protein